MEKTCRNCKYFKPGFAGFFCLASGAGGCISNSLWEPKEEEKVEKLYTTGQMIDMLEEKKELFAETFVTHDLCVGWCNLTLCWLYKDTKKYHAKFEIIGCGKDQWRIIEPELQEVEFWEVYKALCTAYKTAKSLVSELEYGTDCNRRSLYHATDEELQGKWIILD